MDPDVQLSWLLLLHCASARANYMTRVVEPGSARSFCEAHDVGIWQCLEEILQNPLAQAGETKNFGSLPMVLGGIGLRSAARSMPAYWASWSDSLAMIRRRHQSVAGQLVNQLQGHPKTPFLRAAAARRELMGVMGFELRNSIKLFLCAPACAQGSNRRAFAVESILARICREARAHQCHGPRHGPSTT